MRTQRDRVLKLLRDGRWHPTIEFVELGILRGPARVHELRRRGFVIEVKRVDRPDRATTYLYRLNSKGLDAAECGEPARATCPNWTPGEVELPSAEERRRIAAEARAEFARALQRRAS